MRIFVIPPLLAFTFALALGLFVLLKGAKSPVNRFFSVLCFETTYWQLCWFLSYLFPTDVAKDFLSRIAYSVIIFIPFTYYQVAVLFLKLPPRKNYVWHGYAFGSLFLILTWTSNLFIAGYRDFWWGSYPKVGSLFSIYLAGVFLFITRALFLIIQAAKNKDLPPSEYNKIKFMALAHFIYYFAAIEYLIDYGIPLYPIGVFLFIACFSIITYAITKHRLMDITVVIGRTAALGLVVGAYLGIFAGLWIASVYFHIPLAVQLIGSLVYLMFTGLTFRQAWDATLTTADKTFIKGWYDYRIVQRRLSNRLRSVTEKEELLPAVQEVLDEELEIREAQVDFLKEGTTLLSSAIVEEIKKTKNVTHLPKESILPKGLAIPCFGNDQLEALILVGPKRNEKPFNEVDLDLFRTLADEVAIVLQRIRPLEMVRADLVVEKGKVEAAQRELERTHRLASLGTLTAGLAHEIRNPMAVLRSRAERGQTKLEDKLFAKETYELMIRNVDRILNIVNRMLQFARAKEDGLVKVDVNKIIEETLSLLEGKIRDKNIEVKKEIKAEGLIMGNPDILSEAFLNIILNGIDFTNRGGALTISTREENKKLVAEIKDTGVGIPEDKLEHIFDPFFTTRAEGTGLGLSISYKIIKEHSGDIAVRSKIGEGTEVTIKLPIIR